MKTTTIRLVRNATLRINYAGHNILVDPFFADKGTIQSALGVYKSPRVHLTMPISEVTEGLDMVLQTHIHPDHYDETVKQHLPKDILYYTQPQDKATVEQESCERPSRFRQDWRDNGTRIGLCLDGRRMPNGLSHGRLQMGSQHPRNGGTVQARLHRGEQRRSGFSGVFQGGRLHHPR